MINLEQNDIIIINLSKGVFILPCEMQHKHTCYDQLRFCHVSLNVIIIFLNI